MFQAKNFEIDEKHSLKLPANAFFLSLFIFLEIIYAMINRQSVHHKRLAGAASGRPAVLPGKDAAFWQNESGSAARPVRQGGHRTVGQSALQTPRDHDDPRSDHPSTLAHCRLWTTEQRKVQPCQCLDRARHGIGIRNARHYYRSRDQSHGSISFGPVPLYRLPG